MISKLIGAAVAAALTLACDAAQAGVNIQQGALSGVTAGKVESFKGIPFAAPPVGDLRWRPPGPAPTWTGVKAADAFGPACMQPQRPGVSAQAISEDCLTLNVWRPAGARPGAKLPVMVWIYGGAFIIGSASSPVYDGTHFAEDGVILVTANYRLGRFGFFAHPALDGGPGPVGNYGLMDQIAALRWVKANIAAFGGDPKNLTLFGESAGAVSINILLASPLARGAFDKAIVESGFARSVGRPLTGEHSAESVGEAFAAAQGIKGEDADAAKALRALSADQLNAAVPGLGDPSTPNPIIDGKLSVESISSAFAKGHEAHVPLLVGGNSYEASLFERQVSARPEAYIARAGDPAEVKAAYGDGPALQVARDVFTDILITEPDRYEARQWVRQGLPVFVYHFSYVPAALRATAPGARHGGEIGYVFDNLPQKPITGYYGATIPAATPDDEKIAHAMHAYWVAFAKTGRPGDADGVAWPRFSSPTEAVMEFGADGVQVRPNFQQPRLDLIEAAGAAP